MLEQTPEGHDVVVGLVDPAWAYEMTFAESNGVMVVAKLSLYPVNVQLLMRQMLYEKKMAVLFGREEDAALCEAAIAELSLEPPTLGVALVAGVATSLADVVPAGGLTSRHLRKVPFRGHPAVATLAKARVVARRLADHFGIGQPPRGPRHRRRGRGRPARSLERLAVVAYYYSEACASSRAPNKEVALSFRTKPAKVRDDVIAARRKGLLTSTRKQGAPGGQLTEKCLEILRMMKAQRQNEDAGENVGRVQRLKHQNTAD